MIRKTYHRGRWFVRDGRRVWSAPAYVSPGRRSPRVGMRGAMVSH
jgi:hypothetical protein